MIKDLRTQISTPVCAGDVDTHELFLLPSLKKVPCLKKKIPGHKSKT